MSPSSTTYTRLRVSYPRPLDLGLRLSREGLFTGIAKMLGSQDIEVGDAAFDADVLVKGKDPYRVTHFLDPARRMRIHRFLMSHKNGTVNDTGVEWYTRGVIRDARRIISEVKSLARFAWHLTGRHRKDDTLKQVLAARSDGRPTEALAILETGRQHSIPAEPQKNIEEVPAEVIEPVEKPAEAEEISVEDLILDMDTPPVEEQVLEGELLQLAGRQDEAKEVFRQALEEAPEDAEIREWAEQPPEEPPLQPESPAPAVPLDIDSVCTALFNVKSSSYQTHRMFEEEYKGREIAWSGVLRTVEPYAYDCVFGSEPGTRAVLEVFEVEAGLYGENKVFAVMQLPEDAHEKWKDAGGETLNMEGRLEKIDGCMRNLYIVAGALFPIR